MSQSRLYRETSNQVIGGVCSGLGTYLNIDPVIVRIIFVLLAIFGGGGLIIYILLWIFVPARDSYAYYQNANDNMEQPPPNEEQQHQPVMDPSRGSLLAGLILITFGAIFLVDRFVPAIDFADLWPLLLIVAGVLLLRNHFTHDKNEEQ
ncbi:MAG: PspC domain-containing protein [Bacteroidales bacterium]|nr:PspC domain-containing protein [Bacteroidales bacterium]MCF8333148.1 PspC domain-containing protein [Bacteroidales bacterium]